MGPLSWLAHLPVLGRLPLTPTVGTLVGVLGVVAASTTGGLIKAPVASPAAAATNKPASVARPAASAKPRAGEIATATQPRRSASRVARPDRPPPRRSAPAAAPVTTHAPDVATPAAEPAETPASPATSEDETPRPGSETLSSEPAVEPEHATPDAPAADAVPLGAPPLTPADDKVTVAEGGTVAIDVLANDTPAHGLTLASVTSPSHGTAESRALPSSTTPPPEPVAQTRSTTRSSTTPCTGRTRRFRSSSSPSTTRPASRRAATSPCARMTRPGRRLGERHRCG